MRIVRHFPSLPKAQKGAAIALGNFDGVHLGHQSILRHCIDIAQSKNIPSAVMTFEPHPREFFSRSCHPERSEGSLQRSFAKAQDDNIIRIYSFRQKINIIRELGIDLLYLVHFNQPFASHSAESFVTDTLHKQLAAHHIVTGTNFAFGKGRSGNTDFLTHKAAELGFGFTACAPVHDASGTPVSSSVIRMFLAAGNIEAATKLLGRPYTIEGRVVRGEQRGRELGFPTANIALVNLFKPRLGIYAVRLSTRDGTWHPGVASIGTKPTFGVYEPLLEVHLFDTDTNLYGSYVRVEFSAFLREEKRFDSRQALILQMHEDSRQARECLSKTG